MPFSDDYQTELNLLRMEQLQLEEDLISPCSSKEDTEDGGETSIEMQVELENYTSPDGSPRERRRTVGPKEQRVSGHPRSRPSPYTAAMAASNAPVRADQKNKNGLARHTSPGKHETRQTQNGKERTTQKHPQGRGNVVQRLLAATRQADVYTVPEEKKDRLQDSGKASSGVLSFFEVSFPTKDVHHMVPPPSSSRTATGSTAPRAAPLAVQGAVRPSHHTETKGERPKGQPKCHPTTTTTTPPSSISFSTPSGSAATSLRREAQRLALSDGVPKMVSPFISSRRSEAPPPSSPKEHASGERQAEAPAATSNTTPREAIAVPGTSSVWTAANTASGVPVYWTPPQTMLLSERYENTSPIKGEELLHDDVTETTTPKQEHQNATAAQEEQEPDGASALPAAETEAPQSVEARLQALQTLKKAYAVRARDAMSAYFSIAQGQGGDPSGTKAKTTFMDATIPSCLRRGKGYRRLTSYDARERERRLQQASAPSFVHREMTKPIGIREARRLAEQAERERQEEEALCTRPKVTPVPASTFFNSYDLMVEEWKERKAAQRRRAEKKAQSEHQREMYLRLSRERLKQVRHEFLSVGRGEPQGSGRRTSTSGTGNRPCGSRNGSVRAEKWSDTCRSSPRRYADPSSPSSRPGRSSSTASPRGGGGLLESVPSPSFSPSSRTAVAHPLLEDLHIPLEVKVNLWPSIQDHERMRLQRLLQRSKEAKVAVDQHVQAVMPSLSLDARRWSTSGRESRRSSGDKGSEARGWGTRRLGYEWNGSALASPYPPTAGGPYGIGSPIASPSVQIGNGEVASVVNAIGGGDGGPSRAMTSVAPGLTPTSMASISTTQPPVPAASTPAMGVSGITASPTIPAAGVVSTPITGIPTTAVAPPPPPGVPVPSFGIGTTIGATPSTLPTTTPTTATAGEVATAPVGPSSGIVPPPPPPPPSSVPGIESVNTVVGTPYVPSPGVATVIPPHLSPSVLASPTAVGRPAAWAMGTRMLAIPTSAISGATAWTTELSEGGQPTDSPEVFLEAEGEWKQKRHEEREKERKQCRKEADEMFKKYHPQLTFHPNVEPGVPDFQKIWEEQQATLQAKKQQRKVTQIQPFDLTPSAKDTILRGKRFIPRVVGPPPPSHGKSRSWSAEEKKKQKEGKEGRERDTQGARSRVDPALTSPLKKNVHFVETPGDAAASSSSSLLTATPSGPVASTEESHAAVAPDVPSSSTPPPSTEVVAAASSVASTTSSPSRSCSDHRIPRGTRAHALRAQLLYERSLTERNEKETIAAKRREEEKARQRAVRERLAPYRYNAKVEHEALIQAKVRALRAANKASEREAKAKLEEMHCRVAKLSPLFADFTQEGVLHKPRAETEQEVRTLLKEAGVTSEAIDAIFNEELPPSGGQGEGSPTTPSTEAEKETAKHSEAEASTSAEKLGSSSSPTTPKEKEKKDGLSTSGSRSHRGSSSSSTTSNPRRGRTKSSSSRSRSTGKSGSSSSSSRSTLTSPGWKRSPSSPSSSSSSSSTSTTPQKTTRLNTDIGLEKAPPTVPITSAALLTVQNLALQQGEKSTSTPLAVAPSPAKASRSGSYGSDSFESDD